MCHHITLILPNRPGEFHRVATLLGNHGVNIEGHHLTSEGSFGILQMLCDEHEKAFRLLKNEYRGYCSQREVLVVTLENRPSQSGKMLGLLFECGINLRNAYTVIGGLDQSLSVLEVDPPDKIENARTLLSGEGYTIR